MHIYTEIPEHRPLTPLLDTINTPKDLRGLPQSSLLQLADEMRVFLLWSVGISGGHFGSGLGVVELTLALHKIYNTPHDKLVWDVGHQCYPHKIVTGRRETLPSIRSFSGLAPFLDPNESVYDTFAAGHSSTSISLALGLALAAKGTQQHNVAIIGDGGLTAGLAFEALNHAGSCADMNLTIILNDNNMSISGNVGALSTIMKNFLASELFWNLRQSSRKIFRRISPLSALLHSSEKRAREHLSPLAGFFSALGFRYFGPIDGHDFSQLLSSLRHIHERRGLTVLHVCTQKGKGYEAAEKEPIRFHALATKVVGKNDTSTRQQGAKWSGVTTKTLFDLAQSDARLRVITPAMAEGSELGPLRATYPDRFYDVGICEQHALTLAAGLAGAGLKPVVVIYATFLQRAMDQLIHDICLPAHAVLIAIDRAGLVGEDGPTHHGIYDLGLLCSVPNLQVLSPSSDAELVASLHYAHSCQSPVAVRYPRGLSIVESFLPIPPYQIGKARCVQRGSKVAILAHGRIVERARKIAHTYGYTCVDMRFIKPLDTVLLQQLQNDHSVFVCVEDHVKTCGLGAQVSLFAAQCSMKVLCLGLPDAFIPHGDITNLERPYLSEEAIVEAIDGFLSAS